MKSHGRTLVLWFAYALASSALAVGTVAVTGLLFFGTAWAFPTLAQGKPLLLEPGTVDAGTLQPGRSVKVAYRLTNLTPRAVFVNGLQSNCTCVSADALPMEIPPHSRRSLMLWVRPVDEQAGKSFAQSADLYLSVPSPQMRLTVVGTVATR